MRLVPCHGLWGRTREGEVENAPERPKTDGGICVQQVTRRHGYKSRRIRFEQGKRTLCLKGEVEMRFHSDMLVYMFADRELSNVAFGSLNFLSKL